MEEIPEEQAWAGSELVAAVVGMHQRMLRNLCLAAETDGDDRDWHLEEASEMAEDLMKKEKALAVWLQERGVECPNLAILTP